MATEHSPPADGLVLPLRTARPAARHRGEARDPSVRRGDQADPQATFAAFADHLLDLAVRVEGETGTGFREPRP